MGILSWLRGEPQVAGGSGGAGSTTGAAGAGGNSTEYTGGGGGGSTTGHAGVNYWTPPDNIPVGNITIEVFGGGAGGLGEK